MKKKVKKIIIIAAATFLVVAAGFFFSITNGLAEGAKVQLNGISLEHIADGSYTGVYEFKRWSNTVVVHVANHRITAIDITKDMAGAEITGSGDEMVRRVIERQDTKVDTIAGATVSSKAYLKAIENALEE